jgi:4-hydroxy-3-methylbut-2-en-1-yl diphosphate reductase
MKRPGVFAGEPPTLQVAVALRTERLALAGRCRSLRSGMGPERATAAARRLAASPARSVALLGFCGALHEQLGPGDVVVASEVLGPNGSIPCTAPELLAAELRRRGMRVHLGPLVSVDHIVHGAEERVRLADEGALAADMESAWLAEGARGRPLAVVRTVVDAPGRELHRPLMTVAAALRAMGSLRAAAPAVQAWAAACRPRQVLLASPRAACAGVDRAIDIVDAALEQYGDPLYVRRQIVHNAHVVAEFEARGVVFVHELHEVPDRATVVFSAHGVSPAVWQEASERDLRVIDATCPLVAKVHAEARRFAARGDTIVLVGHSDHDEVEGVIGEAPAHIRVVSDAAQARALDVDDPSRVSYLTQTTLAVDETAEVIDTLRARFPAIAGPGSDDICYATQNRQDAVRAIAPLCDRIIVVGSANSSNSNRLVEVAERSGCPARLVEDESALDLAWLGGAAVVGLTAGASARESLVERVLAALGRLGELEAEERAVARETVRFKLSAGLQRRR